MMHNAVRFLFFLIFGAEENFRRKTFTNCDDFFFSAPPIFWTGFDKHINWHKIITRGRINIPRPDFESSRRILSRYEFVDAKFCVFHAFL